VVPAGGNIEVVHLFAIIQLKLVFNGKPVGFSERNSYFHTKEIENSGKDHILLCAFKNKPLEKWLVYNCTTIGMSLRPLSKSTKLLSR
jgi:hypothetical protein